MASCAVCRASFDGAEGTYYEWGLTCRPCHLAVQATPSMTGTNVADDAASAASTIAMNVVGLGLLAATGVGFTYHGGAQGEPMPIPDHQRLRMAMPAIQARLQRQRSMQAIYLRRGPDELGPFTVEQLAAMWEAGEVLADDEYWHEGLDGYRPVTQFTPV